MFDFNGLFTVVCCFIYVAAVVCVSFLDCWWLLVWFVAFIVLAFVCVCWLFGLVYFGAAVCLMACVYVDWIYMLLDWLSLIGNVCLVILLTYVVHLVCWLCFVECGLLTVLFVVVGYLFGVWFVYLLFGV